MDDLVIVLSLLHTFDEMDRTLHSTNFHPQFDQKGGTRVAGLEPMRSCFHSYFWHDVNDG